MNITSIFQFTIWLVITKKKGTIIEKLDSIKRLTMILGTASIEYEKISKDGDLEVYLIETKQGELAFIKVNKHGDFEVRFPYENKFEILYENEREHRYTIDQIECMSNEFSIQPQILIDTINGIVPTVFRLLYLPISNKCLIREEEDVIYEVIGGTDRYIIRRLTYL